MSNPTGQVRVIPKPQGYRFIRGANSQIDAITNLFVDYKPQIRFVYSCDLPPLNPPNNLIWEQEGDNIVFEWDAPEPTEADFLGYYLYENDVRHPELINDINHIIPVWIQAGIRTFYVTASYKEGESGTSNIVKIELDVPPPLNPPRNLTVRQEGNNVIFDWEAPEATDAELLGYHFYRYLGLPYGDPSDLITETSHTIPAWVDDGAWGFHVTAVYKEGESEPSNKVSINITDEYDHVVPPNVTRLGNNYPNPFNPSTTIYFYLHENTHARLDIFNIRGQSVKTLVDAMLIQGKHFVEWDGVDNTGNHVGSGLYLYRLETESHIETRRMILLK
jgi:hypothetical protein